jgi:hypothetical protein
MLALLAILVSGIMVVPAARAANEPTRAPEWKVEGKVLGENETRALSAKVPAGEVLFEGAGGKLRVKCKEGKLAAGSFIANQNEEAIVESNPELSDCKVEGDEKSGEKCEKVEEPIKTKTIRSEFVLNDLEPGVGGKILMEFDPRKGEEWVELKFPEAGCKIANTIVKGLTVALLWNNNVTEEIELGKNVEGTSYVLKWPDGPKSVYLWSQKEKRFALFEPTYLKEFTEAADVTGELLITVAEDKKFGLVSEGKEEELKNEPTRAPEWKVEGETLAANETIEITAKVPAGKITLEDAVGKPKIVCEEGKLARGSFIANQNEEAISEWTPELTKCKVEGNGEECTKVTEPIKFKPVRAEFVLKDESGKIGSKV